MPRELFYEALCLLLPGSLLLLCLLQLLLLLHWGAPAQRGQQLSVPALGLLCSWHLQVAHISDAGLSCQGPGHCSEGGPLGHLQGQQPTALGEGAH